MRKLFLLLPLLMLFVLTSCDEQPVDTSLKIGEFRANIDGNEWKADAGKVTAKYVEGEYGLVLRILAVKTIDATRQEEFQIILKDPVVDYVTSVRADLSRRDGDVIREWSMEKAVVKITQLDDTQIKGSFSFKPINMEDKTKLDIQNVEFWIEITE